jgi:hypothetical protein
MQFRDGGAVQAGSTKMRAIIYAGLAIGLTVIAFSFWPRATHVSPKERTLVTIGAPNKAEAAAVEARISPFEIMVKYGRDLPIENWRDPF